MPEAQFSKSEYTVNATSIGPPAITAFWISLAPLAVTVLPENEYLSSAKLLWGAFAVESQALGPAGEVSEGQPGLPSAGYGSLPCGPWWWQWGSEKSLHMPSPNGPEPLYCPPPTAPLPPN